MPSATWRREQLHNRLSSQLCQDCPRLNPSQKLQILTRNPIRHHHPTIAVEQYHAYRHAIHNLTQALGLRLHLDQQSLALFRSPHPLGNVPHKLHHSGDFSCLRILHRIAEELNPFDR